MTRYWVSWCHDAEMGVFELRNPWWVSGSFALWDDGSDEDYTVQTICAAVEAASLDAAKKAVISAYDTPPSDMVWRFAEERPDNWSPFSERFQRADWMQWPDAA